MHSFTEWYRVMSFARTADGDFSYLWYGRHYSMAVRLVGTKRTYTEYAD